MVHGWTTFVPFARSIQVWATSVSAFCKLTMLVLLSSLWKEGHTRVVLSDRTTSSYLQKSARFASDDSPSSSAHTHTHRESYTRNLNVSWFNTIPSSTLCVRSLHVQRLRIYKHSWSMSQLNSTSHHFIPCHNFPAQKFRTSVVCFHELSPAFASKLHTPGSTHSLLLSLSSTNAFMYLKTWILSDCRVAS